MAKVKIVKKTRKNILLKVKPEQLETFRRQAKRYTQGNVSLWLRTAATLKLTSQQAALVKKQA